jgi:hypothetical protein
MGFAALVLGGMGTARADAPGDAWGAAQKLLPSAPTIVLGMNVATIKGSDLFKELYPMLMAQAGEVKDGLEEVRQTCAIDVKEAVQGAVVSVDDSSKGVVFLSLKGITSARVNECIQKVGAKQKKNIVVGKPDAKGIVEYSAAGDARKLYLAFLANNVIAMATEPFDKELLTRWIGGTGVDAKSRAGKAVASVNTNAAVWAVVVKPQKLDEGMNMKLVYGNADVSGGTISGDVRLVLASAKEATAALAKSNSELEKAKKEGQIPPQLASLMKTLKMTAKDDELQLKASMPESEALAVIKGAVAPQ